MWGLGTLHLTGEMMTNPAVVRALIKLSASQKMGANAFAGAVKQLGAQAKFNPALLPLYQQASGLAQASSAPLGATVLAQPQDSQQSGPPQPH